MAVKFDLGNGTICVVQVDDHPMHTHRGIVPADQVVQGDRICNIGGEPFVEVVAPPVVS